MAYLAHEAPVPAWEIVGIIGLFYIAILVSVLAAGAALGTLDGALPVIDWTYASSFTA
jgi:hypothetical protein